MAVKCVQKKIVALEGAGLCPHSGPALGAPVGGAFSAELLSLGLGATAPSPAVSHFAVIDQEERLKWRTQHGSNSSSKFTLSGPRTWGFHPVSPNSSWGIV